GLRDRVGAETPRALLPAGAERGVPASASREITLEQLTTDRIEPLCARPLYGDAAAQGQGAQRAARLHGKSFHRRDLEILRGEEGIELDGVANATRERHGLDEIGAAPPFGRQLDAGGALWPKRGV